MSYTHIYMPYEYHSIIRSGCLSQLNSGSQFFLLSKKEVTKMNGRIFQLALRITNGGVGLHAGVHVCIEFIHICVPILL